MTFPEDLNQYLSPAEVEQIAYNAVFAAFSEKARKAKLEAYSKKLGRGPQHPAFANPAQFGGFVYLKGEKRAKAENWKNPFDVPPHLKELWSELICYYGGFPELCKKIKPHHKIILIAGPVGTGKTNLLRLLAQNPVQSFRVMNAKEINDQCRAKDAYTTTIQKYTNMIPHNCVNDGYFGQSELALCIDDMGTEPELNIYGNKSRAIEDIIFGRYQNLKNRAHITTIITTNLPPKEIHHTYGKRIQDRLFETAALFAIPGDTKSFRA